MAEIVVVGAERQVSAAAVGVCGGTEVGEGFWSCAGSEARANALLKAPLLDARRS